MRVSAATFMEHILGPLALLVKHECCPRDVTVTPGTSCLCGPMALVSVMVLDDKVFGYVASAPPNEARLAALPADVAAGGRSARVCIVVMNEVSIASWREAFRAAVDTAQAAGDTESAAAWRESFDHIEMAMAAAPRALGITGPVM